MTQNYGLDQFVEDMRTITSRDVRRWRDRGARKTLGDTLGRRQILAH